MKKDDKPHLHPEIKDIKNICDVSPKTKSTKDVCDKMSKDHNLKHPAKKSNMKIKII